MGPAPPGAAGPRRTLRGEGQHLSAWHRALLSVLAAAGAGALLLALDPGGQVVRRALDVALRSSPDGQITGEGVALVRRAIRMSGLAGLTLAAAAFAGVWLLRPRCADLAGGPGARTHPGGITTPSRGAEWLALAGILVASFLLLARELSVSLWYDEAFTATRYIHPHRPWLAFVRFEDLNNHPLYSFSASLSAAAFGLSEASLRLPSVLAALGCTAALYLLLRPRAGLAAAIAGAALSAFSAAALDFGSQARGYGLLLLWSACALWALFRAVEGPSPMRWILWSGAAAAGLLTNLSFLAALPVHFGAVALWSRGEPWEGSRARLSALLVATALAGGVALGGYALVLPRVLFELAAYSTVWRGPGDLLGWILAGAHAPPWSRAAGVAGLAAVLMLSVAGAIRGGGPDRRLSGLGAVVLGFGLVLHVLNRGEVRFFVALLPIVWAAVAWSMGELTAWRRSLPRAAAGLAVTLLVFVAYAGGLSSRWRLVEPGLRRAAAAIEETATSGACVVADWSVGDVLGFYAPGVRTVGNERECPPGAWPLVFACQRCSTLPPPGALLVAEIEDRSGHPYRVYRISR